mgnify:CR=1 FL=1
MYFEFCQGWSGEEVLGCHSCVGRGPSEGPLGFGSPSWRVMGSAPQARLGATCSTTWITVCTLCRDSTNKAVGVQTLVQTCVFCRGHLHCPHIRHVRTNIAGLSSPGAHAFTPNKAADAHCPNGRELNGEWAGSRGFPWRQSRRATVRPTKSQNRISMAQRHSARQEESIGTTLVIY